MPSKKKTYYFCRVFFDYYESPQITNILRRMNGADIIVLHQKMLMHTANTDNIYKFWGDDNDADRVAEIAYNLRVEEKVVKEGLEILFKAGLIEHCAEGIYVPFLPDVIDVGKETSDARIKAKQRKNNKLETKREDIRVDNVLPDNRDKSKNNNNILLLSNDNEKNENIIDFFNLTFGKKFRKTEKNLKTIEKALTRITEEEAIKIIGNEHQRQINGEMDGFYPNIGWMFGTALDECLMRIKKQKMKNRNKFNDFQQNEYDFETLEKELMAN